MPLIVLYKCDGPECEKMSPVTETRYWGKFPKEFIRVLVHTHGGPKNQSEPPAFCSHECMLNWLGEKHGVIWMPDPGVIDRSQDG
jgi:hypothetical protein